LEKTSLNTLRNKARKLHHALRLVYKPDFWKSLYISLGLLRQFWRYKCISINVYDTSETGKAADSLVLTSHIYLSGDVVNLLKDQCQLNDDQLNTYHRELEKVGYALYAPQVIMLALAQAIVITGTIWKGQAIWDWILQIINQLN
jgi:hypothetical protein